MRRARPWRHSPSQITDCVAIVGFVDHDEDMPECCRGYCRWPGAGRLLQAVSPELRGIRRSAVLPRGRPADRPRHRGCPCGRRHLRGHLVSSPCGCGTGPCSPRRDRLYLVVAVPRGPRATPASACCRPGRRTARQHSSTATRLVVRMRWCSTDGLSVIAASGEVVARATRSSARSCSSPISSWTWPLAAACAAPLLRRLEPLDGPAPVFVSDRRTRGCVPLDHRASTAPVAGARGVSSGVRWFTGVRDYVRQERTSRASFMGLVRRHRLRADGGAWRSTRWAPTGCAAWPCRRCSRESRSTDGRTSALAGLLGIRMDVIEIAPVVDAFETATAWVRSRGVDA